MTLLAGVFAIAAALGGAVVWAGITYITGYQIGFMAIGIGALVGAGARFGGGEGKITALFAGGLAIVAMLLGNVMATQVALNREITEFARIGLSREAYDEEFAMADEFVLLSSEEAYPQFIFEKTYYTEASSAQGVMDEEIQLFLTEYAPELRRIHEERPTYEKWRARRYADLKAATDEIDLAGLVLDDIGVTGAIFMVIGLFTAMRVVGEWD